MKLLPIPMKWRYCLNPHKSKVFLFGSNIPSPHHLVNQRWEAKCCQGVLAPIYVSSGQLPPPQSPGPCDKSTWDAWSSFFALKHAGTSFRCLHPITTLRLYTIFALPRMLKSGVCSNTELEMLPAGKFLEQSKDSLLDLLRRALTLFLVVPPSQTLSPSRNITFIPKINL